MIPTLFDKQAYDDWIATRVNAEVNVLEEQYTDQQLAELSEDEIRQSVEHSGHMFKKTSDWVDAYHDILEHTDALVMSRTIEIPDEDPFSKMADVARRCVVTDVQRQVLHEIRETYSTPEVPA